jgi:hypothetical protein
MSETEEKQAGDGGAAGGMSPTVKSAIFFGILVGVVGVFWYLSNLEHPPDLPADEVHKFRFNTNGELVGLSAEAKEDAPTVEQAGGLEYDKKGIEQRVNNLCINCHGAPTLDLSAHACLGTGKCIPEGHPPKSTCIKCHRHAGK